MFLTEVQKSALYSLDTELLVAALYRQITNAETVAEIREIDVKMSPLYDHAMRRIDEIEAAEPEEPDFREKQRRAANQAAWDIKQNRVAS